jgi:hypothetical protein
MAYGQDGNNTRVLIYPSTLDAGSITTGNLLSVDGNATLVSIEAAEFNGAMMKDITNRTLPTNFAVTNYPNPFNPTATIQMDLPKAADWTISIYNVAGQRVADFAGHSEVGTVTVEWNADGFASGLYFYKAEAGSYKMTKKMVLLK